MFNCYNNYMEITKFGHACIFISKAGKRLVIDPGSFTKLPNDLNNIPVLVISEEHYDHFSIDNVKAILAVNPELHIYTTQKVFEDLAANGITSTAIDAELSVEDANFNLRFRASDHAVVHGTSPCRVVTVEVDDLLYYAADSYTPTNKKVKVLAIPTSGPWFKTTEVIDYANAADAEFVLATHNSLNSEAGNNVTHHFLETHIKDKQLLYLGDGESRAF